MVKAPRSKGCRVCVERRVKCDQRRPFCLRCQKANRQCPGYEVMNFVDEGPSVRELYKNVGRGSKEAGQSVGSRESSVSSASSRTNQDNAAPFEYLTVLESVSRAGTSPLRNVENRTPDFERSTLVAIISPSAYQAQFLSQFINSISSTTTMSSIVPAFHCHSVWMTEIACRVEVSSTLIWAIRAISLSHLGHQIGDKNLIINSRSMYGRALLKLNKALQDDVEGLSSDTLSATVLLSFYELLTCTEKHSWVRHAGGAGNLMRLRGPDRHRTGIDSAVFLACRYTLIIEAFQGRKPCFLATPQWKQLSRDLAEQAEQQSPFNTAREDYFQEISALPGFAVEAVDFMSSGGRDTSALRDLIRQGHRHRSSTKTVQARLTETLRDAGQEPTLTASSVDDKLFPTVYQYPSNLVASYYCGHWSLLIMLNIILIGLEAKLLELSSPELPDASGPSRQQRQPGQRELTPGVNTSAAPSNQPGRNLPLLWLLTENTRRGTSPVSTAVSPSEFPTMSANDTTSRRQMYLAENILCARETCKSVEGMSMSMFLGPLFLVFALRNAMRVLTEKEEETWIINKLEMISKTFGIAKIEVEIYRQEKHL